MGAGREGFARPGAMLYWENVASPGSSMSRKEPAMPKLIKCIGEVLPDGHLSVPEEVRQTLASTPYTAPDHDQTAPARDSRGPSGMDGIAPTGTRRYSRPSVRRLRHHDRYLYGKDR